ncbi:mannose-specific lectin-like [Wolffia australiana]
MATRPLYLSPVFVFLFLISSSNAANYIYSGQFLAPGQALVAGGFALVMERDCSLTLKRSPGITLWSSGTSPPGINSCITRLETNGQLDIYAGPQRPVWSTPARKDIGRYVIILEADGSLVIYGPGTDPRGIFVRRAGPSNFIVNANTTGGGSENKP